MNFGFDVDGTITAAPQAFAAMASALLAAGHEVHVITGTMDAAVTAEHLVARRAQLDSHGFPECTALQIVTAPHAEQKAAYCRNHDIVMMFEDSPVYIEAIRAGSSTVVLAMPS